MASAAMRVALDKIAHDFPLKRVAWAAFPWDWADSRGEYSPTERLLAEDRAEARADRDRDAEWRSERDAR